MRRVNCHMPQHVANFRKMHVGCHVSLWKRRHCGSGCRFNSSQCMCFTGVASLLLPRCVCSAMSQSLTAPELISYSSSQYVCFYCVTTPSHLRQSRAVRSRYARLLFVPEHTPQFSTEQIVWEIQTLFI